MVPEKEPPRTIRLCCPSLSKSVVQLEAREEQRLDVGYIARAFGLEPWSVRLNGYFISRGADMVSPSVTWRSLQQFFSSKGLPTGDDGRGPVIVGGKFFEAGSKRLRGSEDPSANGNGRRDPPWKKLKSQGSGHFGLKRKPEEVTVETFKRLKINQEIPDPGEEANRQLGTIPSRPVSCGHISENTKRQREDDAIVAASVKRVR